jgi:hypothetical protein
MLPDVERDRRWYWIKVFAGGGAAWTILSGETVNYVAVAVLVAVVLTEVKLYYEAYQNDTQDVTAAN